MKRLLHLLAKAVLLVIVWVAIFEFGFRLQQYFGPLYDLEMADVNLNWEIRRREPSGDAGKTEPVYLRRFDRLQLQKVI